MRITDQQIENDLALLRDSAAELGSLWGAVKAGEHLVKQYRARAFLAASGTVAEREAIALTDPEVARAQNDYENAEADYKTLWAKREAAKIEIDAWRTWNASSRAKTI